MEEGSDRRAQSRGGGWAWLLDLKTIECLLGLGIHNHLTHIPIVQVGRLRGERSIWHLLFTPTPGSALLSVIGVVEAEAQSGELGPEPGSTALIPYTLPSWERALGMGMKLGGSGSGQGHSLGLEVGPVEVLMICRSPLHST